MGKISGLVKRKGASLGIRIDEANGGFGVNSDGYHHYPVPSPQQAVKNKLLLNNESSKLNKNVDGFFY